MLDALWLTLPRIFRTGLGCCLGLSVLYTVVWQPPHVFSLCVEHRTSNTDMNLRTAPH